MIIMDFEVRYDKVSWKTDTAFTNWACGPVYSKAVLDDLG